MTASAGIQIEEGDAVAADGEHVAIVSGAASGIGAAVADVLGKSGWTVAGLDLHECQGVALPLQLDVSDSRSVDAAVAEVEGVLGSVRAVVSAAGYYEMIDFDQITPTGWNKMLQVHLGGLFNLTRAALPTMLQRNGGVIVAIASELAIGGGSRDAHYAAAKGAVIGLIRSLAVEVGPKGVRVNGVAPGPTDTPLLSQDSPWRATEYLSTLPVGHLADPSEVAETVRFIIEEGTFMNGEIVSINSGAVI